MEKESKIPSRKAIRIGLFLLFVISLFMFLYFFLAKMDFGKFFSLAMDYVNTDLTKIENQEGRVNLLVLGKSGAGHDGSDLTDSIMLVSISSEKSKIDTISIPRDVWIPSIRAKINSAYYWGKQKDETTGLSFAKDIASELLQEKINYGIVIDFDGFTEIVDVIGGIDVDVENAFTDPKYPIKGKENDLCDGDKELKCRYETIVFEKGIQKMNGDTALKFVRSRNAQGDEGTDLARSARQQKVINSIKDKMLTYQILLNPVKLYESWRVAEKYIETDLKFSSLGVLGKLVVNARNDIRQHNIPEEYLFNPPISSKYDLQYVFIPASGSWEDLRSWVNNQLSK